MKKIKYDETMLGSSVSVFTNSSAVCRGFEAEKVYVGKLQEKVDWLIGCPVFECYKGTLALGYECELIET